MGSIGCLGFPTSVSDTVHEKQWPWAGARSPEGQGLPETVALRAAQARDANGQGRASCRDAPLLPGQLRILGVATARRGGSQWGAPARLPALQAPLHAGGKKIKEQGKKTHTLLGLGKAQGPLPSHSVGKSLRREAAKGTQVK